MPDKISNLELRPIDGPQHSPTARIGSYVCALAGEKLPSQVKDEHYNRWQKIGRRVTLTGAVLALAISGLVYGCTASFIESLPKTPCKEFPWDELANTPFAAAVNVQTGLEESPKVQRMRLDNFEQRGQTEVCGEVPIHKVEAVALAHLGHLDEPDTTLQPVATTQPD